MKPQYQDNQMGNLQCQDNKYKENLPGKNLSEANLPEANLPGKNLPEANLTEANLPEANRMEENASEDNTNEGNQYDESGFFSAYMEMPRSKGLSFAGEWHQLEPLIPDVRGKTVLDLGCGLGWHCKYFSNHGAESVIGIDSSRNMLERAGQINPADPFVNHISYRLCSIPDYEYPQESFNLVFSNLALHYLKDLSGIYKRVYQTLKKEGIFLFNIEHPTFTAGVNQEWLTDQDGRILCWPVDNYYYPGVRNTDFLGYQVKKYHHTLTEILNPLITVGFTLTAVVEAMPPENMMDIPGMEAEMRRPMMLLVKAQKK